MTAIQWTGTATSVAVVVILLAVAVVAAVIYRDSNIKAPVPIITLALVLALGYAGLSNVQNTSKHNRLADQLTAQKDAHDAALLGYEALEGQYETCVAKVSTRADIRTVLFQIVDLTDLFPNNAPLARQYTQSRQQTINAEYPMLDEATECGTQPVPPPDPTTTTPDTSKAG